MFSVYGVTGRVFTGSMEQLRHIEQVNAASRIRRLESSEIDLVTPAPSEHAAANPTLPAALPLRTALAAYAQTQQGETLRKPLTLVHEIMVHPALTLALDATVLEASKLLTYHGHAQAPVIDGNGILVGLLLRSDMLRAERLASPEMDLKEWQAMLSQPVRELMWTPVPSVAADTDIRRLASVLLDTGLPGLPVVDETGTVKAFVARGDILRAVAHDPPLDLWG